MLPIHVLLHPHRDGPRANLLIRNNADRRRMMIMGQRAQAAYKQKAHKATKKLCEMRSPPP